MRRLQERKLVPILAFVGATFVFCLAAAGVEWGEAPLFLVGLAALAFGFAWERLVS
jgi:hypothetical protein